MNENPEQWKDFPNVVEWVSQMKAWAEKYQIYEFIKADASGQDPSGRIRSLSLPEDSSFDESLVWTVFDSSSEVVITSEFSTGMGSSSGAIGWYLGREPHSSEKEIYDYLKRACNLCSGESIFTDSDGEEQECENCLEASTSVWLDETDFRLT